jgi:O-antigen ligase
MEWGVKRVKDVFLTPRASPVLLVEETDGTVAIKGITVWKAHNQFLDIALLRGLVGLLCYIGLFWYVIRSLSKFPPLAMGLIVYHAFLLLWFAPFHIEGTLWAVLGGACATGSLPGRRMDNV